MSEPNVSHVAGPLKTDQRDRARCARVERADVGDLRPCRTGAARASWRCGSRATAPARSRAITKAARATKEAAGSRKGRGRVAPPLAAADSALRARLPARSARAATSDVRPTGSTGRMDKAFEPTSLSLI